MNPPRPLSVHRLARVALLGLVAVARVPAADRSTGVAPVPTPKWVENLFAGLKAPVPPRHLVGNIYYVGTNDISSFLITTPAGAILLDTSFADTVPIVERGVTELGFKLTDIKVILSSHAHIDHVGGHALMKKLTGARVVASAADARLLESGGAEDFLPWPKDTLAFTPVKVDEIVADGGQVTLGGVTLTAHLTPGHTRGATTWTMDTTEAGRTYHVLFFSSTTVNPGVSLWRAPSYPGIVADYEATYAKLKTLPCDIFFAAHGSQFGRAEKFARQDRGEGAGAFVDPAGWRAFLAKVENAYRTQLEAERLAAAP